MKPNQLAAKLVSELMPKRIVDQSAQTVAELQVATGMSKFVTQVWCKEHTEMGEIERVSKMVNGKPQPAYRIKK